MRAFVEQLKESPLVVELPAAGMSSFQVTGEVLIQEGVVLWAAPVSHLSLMERLRSIFADRVTWGVCGVRDGEDFTKAAEQGATFVLADVMLSRDVVMRAQHSHIAVVQPGLSPREVCEAGELTGVAAVLPAPRDSTYARWMRRICPDVTLIARGSLGMADAHLWLAEGVDGVSSDVMFEVGKRDLNGVRLDIQSLMRMRRAGES